MEIIKLQFTSPKELNELKQAQQSNPVFWTLHGTDEDLELNTEDWHICSETTQAKIDQWEVNEGLYQMKLSSSNPVEGFKPLDYPFAVSMIGQIGNKALLQCYLSSLQDIYLPSSKDAENNQEKITKKENENIEKDE